MPGLGGLRRARRGSTNLGWRNASFRGFADYMQTSTFRKNLDRCIALAERERVVLMCAEAVPWRCHRSLIADALLVRGIEASEIASRVRTQPHSLTPWARVTGTQVTYPAIPALRRSARAHDTEVDQGGELDGGQSHCQFDSAVRQGRATALSMEGARTCNSG